MTIAIDHASLGSTSNGGGSTTVAFTTTTTVGAGAFIVVTAAAFEGGGGTITFTIADNGPGLTWTTDKQGGIGGGNVCIASAQAPSGMASGTVITATLSTTGAAGASSISGMSFTGVATSSAVDGTPPAIATPSGTGWASNAATIANGSVLVGVAYEITTDATSTPTSPSVEAFDIPGSAGSYGHTAAYRIEATGGSFTVAGTWTTSVATNNDAVIAVAYKAGAGTTIVSPVRAFGPSYAAQRAARI